MWNYNHTDELYHWGIKGMKWGVRRYQNKDGSLTPAGKKRYDYIETGNAASKKYNLAKTRMKRAKKSGDNEAYERAKNNFKQVDKETKYDRKRSYHGGDKAIDEATYGKKGQQRIEDRINKGTSRAAARRKEFTRQFSQGVLASVAIADLTTGAHGTKAVLSAGAKAVNSFMQSEAAKRSVVKIAQNPKFDPIDVMYKIVN